MNNDPQDLMSQACQGSVLALDIGERRIGIAASDARRTIAYPVAVLSFDEVCSMSRRFRMVLEDHDPVLLIVGLPLSLDGVEHAQAARIREVAAEISKLCALEVEFVDERLSSTEAKRILREQGINEKNARGKIDMVAASLFLQSWIDSKRLM